MDIEYHYWITAYIAYKAGFSEEEVKLIAYASQFVDENDVCFEIEDRTNDEKYNNYISQTMNILKPKKELMRIYPVFHFIPGEPDARSARRRDGKRHILNTTPNSEKANLLIDDSFKANEQTRLFRIGIATHGYIDSWAHQNFVGWYDCFNNIGLDIKPDIGHVDGECHPDWVSHKWVDNRLVEADINNKLRFLSAVKELFKKYCSYQKSLGKPNKFDEWLNIEQELNELQGPTYTGKSKKYEDKRIKRYREKMNWIPGFDERQWFDEVIETEIKGLQDTHEGILAHFTLFKDTCYWKDGINKEETNWFRFQEAVKEHQKFALGQLSHLFKEMGLGISRAENADF